VELANQWTPLRDNFNLIMSDNFNEYSDNDFEDNVEYSFTTDNFEVIMDRMRSVSDFFQACEVDYLIEMWQKFQKPNPDGTYNMSVNLIEKFSDFLVGENLNELVKKGLVELAWSDEHNDFVFSAKNSSGV